MLTAADGLGWWLLKAGAAGAIPRKKTAMEFATLTLPFRENVSVACGAVGQPSTQRTPVKMGVSPLQPCCC